METIQLQCGNCKNVMAISVAHLGQQVQCPHCRSVVQTPAAEPAAETAALPAAPNLDLDRPEIPPATTAPREPAPPRDDDLTQFKPKARKDRSVLLLIALIFLVPYALTMTFFVIWLLIVKPNSTDGLEYLRDPEPSPKQGAPRPTMRKRPPHDAPVASHRKATIGQTLTVGDLQVTPLRVAATKDGDLKLVFRAKNVGAKVAFQPMSLIYVNEIKARDKLYTFLEARSKSMDPVYGGDLAYHKTRDAKDAPEGFALLGPGDEVTVAIITHERFRKGPVAAIAESKGDDFTWRVQVRRGFVKVDGKNVSATTVIGVDFSSADIEKS